VLLGSAGLNLAVAWKMQGGSGCTCMDPLAYGLREHEVFDTPFKIQRDAMIRIETPEWFRDNLDVDEIEVLPLVDDYERDWRSGWCTYSTYFDKNPDVEQFCGGVNHKTPTAAGLWRQGNLFHFGFQQSPREMNIHGQQLLLNSIAYIARFTEDRPIATTPSVFAGPISRSRTTPARWLKQGGSRTSWALDIFEPKTKAILEGLETPSEQVEWCQEHADFFFPMKEHLLGIDEDLQTMGVAFDTPEFFDRVIRDLTAADSKTVERAQRLLDRYVPCGPGFRASADDWQEWLDVNQPYLFALDTGDYRWYIDELAKRREIPSLQLRGPLRADSP